jgi:hypothetical protein
VSSCDVNDCPCRLCEAVERESLDCLTGSHGGSSRTRAGQAQSARLRMAQGNGYIHLASWPAEAERAWSKYGKKRRSLLEQVNYYDQLTAQLPTAPVRVVYTASGTIPAAAIVIDSESVIEHKLYWTALSIEEGRYLEASLNSDVTRRLVEPRQSRGQWGPRDLDKYVLERISGYRGDGSFSFPRKRRESPQALTSRPGCSSSELANWCVERLNQRVWPARWSSL